MNTNPPRACLHVLAVALAPVLATALVVAADKPPYDPSAAAAGAALFKTHCATCHGANAQGDGPLADQLRVSPADLTRISRRSGGKFPFEKVFRAIDGRQPVTGHGSSDMPVWGDAFLTAQEGYNRAKVKDKIRQLVHYLASIQSQGK